MHAYPVYMALAFRSGYLQRSLIKSLESLHLAYDGSVRDADGSILQFVYADDAMDPANANALKNMQSVPICQLPLKLF